jgi:hypothetical protein
VGEGAAGGAGATVGEGRARAEDGSAARMGGVEGERQEREEAYHEDDERQQPHLSGNPSEGRERVGERRKMERGGFSRPRSWVRGRGEWGGPRAGPRPGQAGLGLLLL